MKPPFVVPSFELKVLICVLTEYLLTTGVDQCIQKFLDVARQIECFFLQKRFQLSVQRPEQVVKEVNYCAVWTVVIYVC